MGAGSTVELTHFSRLGVWPNKKSRGVTTQGNYRPLTSITQLPLTLLLKGKQIMIFPKNMWFPGKLLLKLLAATAAFSVTVAYDIKMTSEMQVQGDHEGLCILIYLWWTEKMKKMIFRSSTTEVLILSYLMEVRWKKILPFRRFSQIHQKSLDHTHNKVIFNSETPIPKNVVKCCKICRILKMLKYCKMSPPHHQAMTSRGFSKPSRVG